MATIIGNRYSETLYGTNNNDVIKAILHPDFSHDVESRKISLYARQAWTETLITPRTHIFMSLGRSIIID